MIEFFRDVLDGPLYIAIVVLSIIFIMAIIGFLMERKKLEKEAKNKIAVVGTQNINTPQEITPIPSVSIEAEQKVESVSVEKTPISNLVQEENPSMEVKKPVFVFEDPDSKE